MLVCGANRNLQKKQIPNPTFPWSSPRDRTEIPINVLMWLRMLHAMCDVNRPFQSTRTAKTCPASACRSAQLLALCKRPQIEDLIARLTDAEFLAEWRARPRASRRSFAFFFFWFFRKAPTSRRVFSTVESKECCQGTLALAIGEGPFGGSRLRRRPGAL